MRTEKLSARVPKMGGISVTTEKGKNPGKYWEKVEFVRVSKNCSNEYRKMVESVSVPENDRIRESTGKEYFIPCE